MEKTLSRRVGGVKRKVLTNLNNFSILLRISLNENTQAHQNADLFAYLHISTANTYLPYTHTHTQLPYAHKQSSQQLGAATNALRSFFIFEGHTCVGSIILHHRSICKAHGSVRTYANTYICI